MSRITEPRYGFSVTEVNAHNGRWYRSIRPDTTWGSFDEYLRWARDTGCQPGYQLRKLDPMKPHGPDNSYWYCSVKAAEIKQMLPPEEKTSPFCQGCEKECPLAGNGCAEWREYWILNWNLNIHRKRVTTPSPPKREFFVYFHPHEKEVRKL